MSTTRSDTARDLDTLMAEYVAVCNRAIADNQDRSFHRQAIRLNRIIWGGSRLRAIVYAGDPREPLAEYMLRFDVGSPRDPDTGPLRVVPPGTGASEPGAFSWRVSVDYLRDVVERRPAWYRRHPVMLDWNWLTSRARDEFRGRRGLALLSVGVAGVLALYWIRRSAAHAGGPRRRC